jgi:alcohol dehydrogenase class IV
MTSDPVGQFEFSTASRVMFGVGISDQLPQIVAQLGSRLVLVTGAQPDRFASIVQRIEDNGQRIARFQVPHEPTLDDIERGLDVAREHRSELVVALGGGSVLDAGKAIAGVYHCRAPLSEYFEIIGGSKPLDRAGIPCIAVPTTFGTGAEVTRNAVIDVPTHGVKVSLRSFQLLPRVALVDPQLSMSVPRDITAATGFDAFTQNLEPYVSNRATPITDALAEASLKRVRSALRGACHDPLDIVARTDMALVSLWGGMCLANARLGAVHGLAGPLGGMLHAPHGAICAALLGPVTRVNVSELRRHGEPSSALGRFTTAARMLTGDQAATADDLAGWIDDLARELGIQGLGVWGLNTERFEEAAVLAARASSMQGNPVRLDRTALLTILEHAL